MPVPLAALKPVESPRDLIVFDTHPIQYRSPLFRELSKTLTGFKVYFFDSQFNGKRWWFHEVGKIPQQTWNIELNSGFENTTLHLHSLSLLKRFQYLTQVVSSERPRALLLFGYYLPEHWWLLKICNQRKIPVLYIGETFSDSLGFRGWIKKRFTKYWTARVHRIISIGTKNESYYKNLGIPDTKVISGKYCIDPKFFTLSKEQSADTRRDWRNKIKVPDNGTVFLFVGRLFDRKRPQDVLELQRRLQDEEKAYLVIIGNGELEGSVRQSVSRLKRCIYLGFQDQNQTKQAYHGCDVLLVPSQYETWGLVINEAFSCGRPAIVTDKCGAAEDLVLNEETGFVYPVGDLDKLEHSCRRLLSDPDLLSKLEKNALERVQEFTPSHFANAIVRACLDR